MPTSPYPSPRFGSHEPWRQLALALAAGLLGLLANIGAPMLGSGLPMRLDVVIVLCMAITAGPAWAALSATIATALVCWHVGHPTLMFVAVLEAVAVGSLVRRRLGIALAAASFWIATALPILYGWSAGILQADSGEATAGALQQALNGVAQAVLVQILAAWPLARTWLRRKHDAPLPLRAQVFDSVIPLADLPGDRPRPGARPRRRFGGGAGHPPRAGRARRHHRRPHRRVPPRPRPGCGVTGAACRRRAA